MKAFMCMERRAKVCRSLFWNPTPLRLTCGSDLCPHKGSGPVNLDVKVSCSEPRRKREGGPQFHMSEGTFSADIP